MKRHIIMVISSCVLGLLLVGLFLWGISLNATHTQAAAPAAPQQVFWEEDFSAALPPDKYYITGTLGSGIVDQETFLVTQPATGQRGRIFYITPTLMTEFDATFSLNLGNSIDGADGVAFNICPSYDYPVNAGGTLDASCPGGYIVAFDTWGEVTTATVYLAKDSVFNRLSTADLTDSLEDGLWHEAEVLLNQGTVTVTLDNVNVIAGFPIPDYEPFIGYFGFSGATGAYYNNQRVDNILVEAEYVTNGYLDGYVHDVDTSAPIAGVTVTGDRLGGGDWSTQTDASGYYSMTVATGIYTVTAEHALYLPVSIPEVEVLPEAVTTLDFSLVARIAFDPSPVHVTLDWGTTAQLDTSLINNMDEYYDFEIYEMGGGFQPMVVSGPTIETLERAELGLVNALEVETIQGGKIAWLYQNTQGVEITTADTGSTTAYPGTYKFIPDQPSAQANILVYADDWVHTPPNTLVQQALSILGLPATVHVNGDFTGFINNLNTGGPWDLVIYSSESYNQPSTVRPALLSYLQGGGKLAATDWNQRVYPSDPLWAEMGFAYLSNYLDPKPAYWWLPNHQIFNTPTDAPEWLVRSAPSGNSQGTIIDPLGDSFMVAGYTPNTQPAQGAMVIRGDGRAIYKAIRDITINSDADSDGVNDGTELWENIIYGLLHGFDIPWLAEYPTAGTVLPNWSLDIGLSFTATLEAGVSQPGDYDSNLFIFGNPSIKIPITMTVLPLADMGKLTGTILDNCTGEAVKAEVNIAGGFPISQTMSNPDTGDYSAWLMAGSYELIIRAMDYYTDTKSVEIGAGETTMLDLSMVPDRPCIAVEPNELEAWVLQDTEVYVHHTGLDFTNAGGQDLEFEISEIPWSIGLSNPASQPVSNNNPSPSNNLATSINVGKQPFITPLVIPGDFIGLANSPKRLTCVAADPETGYIYAQENNGVAFYRYDPWANSWIQLADSPLNSGNNGGAKVLNGKVYTVYTGNNAKMGVYDISSNTWSTISNGFGMGTGNIATDGEYLYLVVGFNFARYDPIGDIWASLASPPVVFQRWGGLDVLDGIIYGHTGNGFTGFAEYNITLDSWTPLPPVPSGAVLGSAIDPAARKYYAYGSYGGNSWYTFDIDTETWSFGIIPLFNVNDGGMAFVGFSSISGVYFVQGETGTGFGRLETLPTVPSVPWVWEEPVSGTVMAGSTQNVEILFTSIVTDPLPLGTYSATLVIANTDPVAGSQFVPTIMHVVSGYTAPTASFETNAPVCPGAEVIFTNTTLPGIPPVNYYQWDFGDGATSAEENPTHLYAAPGVYEVNLEVCNIEDLCDTATASVEVLGLPQANFSYNAEGVELTFTNLSLYATGFNWSFGDGSNSTVKNPIHSYPAIGTYTVALAAISVCGDDEFSAQVRAGSFIYLPVITKIIQP